MIESERKLIDELRRQTERRKEAVDVAEQELLAVVCSGCGEDLTPREKKATGYTIAPLHGEIQCLRNQLATEREKREAAEGERDAERKRREFAEKWYGARWDRMRRLIEEEAPTILDRACAVMANGKADVNERPKALSTDDAWGGLVEQAKRVIAMSTGIIAALRDEIPDDLRSDWREAFQDWEKALARVQGGEAE